MTTDSSEFVYAVRCEKCLLPIVVGPDSSNGTAPITFEFKGYASVTCQNPLCRHEGAYEAAQIGNCQVWGARKE